jgi:hypothetical protein
MRFKLEEWDWCSYKTVPLELHLFFYHLRTQVNINERNQALIRHQIFWYLKLLALRTVRNTFLLFSSYSASRICYRSLHELSQALCFAFHALLSMSLFLTKSFQNYWTVSFVLVNSSFSELFLCFVHLSHSILSFISHYLFSICYIDLLRMS